jgi:hypothetical protein
MLIRLELRARVVGLIMALMGRCMLVPLGGEAGGDVVVVAIAKKRPRAEATSTGRVQACGRQNRCLGPFPSMALVQRARFAARERC